MIFHVQTGWALLFVLQLIALLFVFPIDNRYEYILMHFKGLTDLVNSATWHFEAFLYIYTIVIIIMNRRKATAALLFFEGKI